MLRHLYTDLKKQLHYYLPNVKYIALFNNQFNHSNNEGSTGRDESAFDYPCIFIEFNDFEFRDLSLGVQEYDFNMTLHIGYKSLLKEDLGLFNALEDIYWVTQRFQQGNNARLSKRSEVWDTDHNNVSIIKQVYRGYNKDYSRYVFGHSPLESLTGTTISATTEFVTSLTYGETSLSGASTENGDNFWIAPPRNPEEC